jgi:hypothetical protein
MIMGRKTRDYKMVGNSCVHGIMDSEACDSAKPLNTTIHNVLQSERPKRAIRLSRGNSTNPAAVTATSRGFAPNEILR